MAKFLRRSAAVMALLALAIVAVVIALDRFSIAPIVERCYATSTQVGTHDLAPDQADNAALIAAISAQRQLPARAATIGIATAMQESRLRNIDYGDRDSLGLFQQRPSQGWGTAAQVSDARYATEAFFDVLAQVKGYQDLEVTQAAQHVQRSAFPEAYAKHENMARAFASALTGNASAALACELRDRTAPGDLSGFLTRLNLDHPRVTVTADAKSGRVVLNVTGDGPALPADEVLKHTWATAQWAVAVADQYGVTSVRAQDQIWDGAASWRTSAALPTGRVELTVATGR